MDYEKKYKEALENAKKCLKDGGISQNSIDYIESIFPELRESEDENIRKEIIKYFKKYLALSLGVYNVQDILAWLEKQGEQKPADKVEPKFKVGDVIRLKGSAAEYTIKKVTDTTYYTNGWSCGIERCEEDYELVEQKPTAWSEEDINMFGSILSTLGICANNPQIPADVRSIHKKEESWFNELYHRAQPKQEWSKEDLNMYDFAIRAIGLCKQYAINHQINGYSKLPDIPQRYEELLSWLKSLKERYTWKPSEEQMEAVQEAINIVGILTITGSKINSLYQDLKKLKGE